MSSERVYERDTDVLFIRLLRERPQFLDLFAALASADPMEGNVTVSGQRRHVGCPGSIDIVVRFSSGPMLLIENKIDAAYSVTNCGLGQPQRYRTSVEAYRAAGVNAISVLLAPLTYLKTTRAAAIFDVQIAYESLRDAIPAADHHLLEAAILQAATPYEPIPNSEAGDFFAGIRQLINSRYPTLTMKKDPNADGIRPDDSRTIYFDVGRTLRLHHGVPKPRMSLQCWDSSAPSASVKLMLPGLAAKAKTLCVPQSLVDIGGYLRPAGRSLGIVIDTPRLDTQTPIIEQHEDVGDALNAALRLQSWWADSETTLRGWVGIS